MLRTGDYSIVHDPASGEDVLSSRDLLLEPSAATPPPTPAPVRFEPDAPPAPGELEPSHASSGASPSPRPLAWVGLVAAFGAIAAAGYFVLELGSPSSERTPPSAPPSAERTEAPASPPTSASAPSVTAERPSASAAAQAVDASAQAAVDAGTASLDASVAAATAPAPSAPVAPAASGAFDDARLAELAPLPEPTARIARMRTSTRASRATAALRSASRNVRRRHYTDAKEAYETALRYLPESTEAMHGLARVALEEEKWDVALAWVQRELAIAPESADAYLVRGDALRGRGDTDAAREAWRKVLELDPRNRDARNRLRRRGRPR